MAGKPTRIDPDAARQQNTRLRASGATLAAALAKLKSATTSYDGCWGNDEFGAAFAKNYKPGADKTLTYSTQLSDAVPDTVNAIDSSITVLEGTDQNNANSL
jgi:uncharacterized protein YukE